MQVATSGLYLIPSVFQLAALCVARGSMRPSRDQRSVLNAKKDHSPLLKEWSRACFVPLVLIVAHWVLLLARCALKEPSQLNLELKIALHVCLVLLGLTHTQEQESVHCVPAVHHRIL